MRFSRYTILLCLALPMVFGHDLEAAGRTIRGTVTPGPGENELPDTIFVTLSGPGFVQATTSMNGTFSFEEVPDGFYSVTVSAPGRISTSTMVDAEGPDSLFPVSVVLGREAGGAADKTLPAPGAPVVDVETLRVPEKARKAFLDGIRYLNRERTSQGGETAATSHRRVPELPSRIQRAGDPLHQVTPAEGGSGSIRQGH